MTADTASDGVETFLAVRPRLFGIAYRMLGSVAEAEDVVQEAWIRWQNTDRESVKVPVAFLTTTVTRLAINAATSARARRETYTGPWLPEPVDTSGDPFLGAERAEALELAVLLLLEKLGPTERASYVLHEAFGYSYRQIAEVLDVSEANARQLARRARQHLGSERSAPASPETQRRLLEAFVAASRDGDLGGLERVLAADVVARSDGGGIVSASRKDLIGTERVVTLFDNVLRKYWSTSTFEAAQVNGGAAMLVRDAGRVVTGVVATDASAEGIERVLIVLNPEKLRGFGGA